MEAPVTFQESCEESAQKDGVPVLVSSSALSNIAMWGIDFRWSDDRLWCYPDMVVDYAEDIINLSYRNSFVKLHFGLLNLRRSTILR